MNIEFDKAIVKSIKGDYAKRTVTITFELPQSLVDTYDLDQLSMYAGNDERPVDLSITGHQLNLFYNAKEKNELRAARKRDEAAQAFKDSLGDMTATLEADDPETGEIKQVVVGGSRAGRSN